MDFFVGLGAGLVVCVIALPFVFYFIGKTLR